MEKQREKPRDENTKCASCGTFSGWGDDCRACERFRTGLLVEAERQEMAYGDSSIFSAGQPDRDEDWEISGPSEAPSAA
jgi:hypothetical protein